MTMKTLAILLAAMPLAWAHFPVGGYASEPQKGVYRAAYQGEAALTALLASGVSVNVTDRDGETALMEAADDGQLEALRLLIKHGANVNAADEDGETALMIAADDGRVAIVRELIAAGADLNARDEDGETALMKAREEGRHEVVRVLTEAGSR